MVALLTDQPEQRGNAAAWGRAPAPVPAPMVPLDLLRTPPAALADALGRALDAARGETDFTHRGEPAAGPRVRAVHERWCDALEFLARAAGARAARAPAPTTTTPSPSEEVSA
jgi:hypothetical protein